MKHPVQTMKDLSAGLPPVWLMLLLLVPVGGCGRGPGEKRMSAILLTLDTTRADALSCYGVTNGITPNLDRLRQESLLYEAAHTVAPLTLVAHASMLTGLYPLRHGVRDNGQWALPESAQTLAELARDRDFRTAAFISAFVLGPDCGLAQGFETYDAPDYDGRFENRFGDMRFAREIVDGALAWLEKRDPDQPFLLWLHFFDPHAPYVPRSRFRQRAQANPAYPDEDYLVEVAYLDHQIGRLLDALREQGLMEESYLMLVSDHGESLEAHGEKTHGAYCYQETLRVPLLVRDPSGHGAGQTSSEVVSVVDVFPTLHEAMGLPEAATQDGVSLFRRSVPPDRGVYFECYAGFLSYGWSPLSGWLDAGGKYVHSSTPEFFRLDTDPLETDNLLESEALDVRRYVRAIEELASRPALTGDVNAELDDETSSGLRELGYAGTGLLPEQIPHPLAPSDLPSPASMVEAHRATMKGLNEVLDGKFEAAVETLSPVVAENPRNYTALDQLSFALMQLDRHPEAIPFLQNLVENGPPKTAYLFNLGQCLQVAGQLDEAIAVFRRAVSRQPDEPRVLKNLARVLHEAGRTDEEQRIIEQIRQLEGE